MERIHIFLDGVANFPNCECPDIPQESSAKPIARGEGAAFITTFVVTSEEDVDTLEYYMKKVIEELRERFKVNNEGGEV